MEAAEDLAEVLGHAEFWCYVEEAGVGVAALEVCFDGFAFGEGRVACY